MNDIRLSNAYLFIKKQSYGQSQCPLWGRLPERLLRYLSPASQPSFPPTSPTRTARGLLFIYSSIITPHSPPFFTPLFPVFFSDFFFSPSAASSSESSP